MKSLEESEILNYDEALARLMNDEEILLIVYAEYVRTIHMQLNDLEKGIAESDNELVIRSAHSIKGASLSIGAEVVAYHAFALETASKAEEVVQYEELKNKIATALDEVLPVIKGYL